MVLRGCRPWFRTMVLRGWGPCRYRRSCLLRSQPPFIRKLEKAVAVRNSLLERFSGKFRCCWKFFTDFPAARNAISAKVWAFSGKENGCCMENWSRLRERCWIFSSETATAFLSSSDCNGRRITCNNYRATSICPVLFIVLSSLLFS